MLKLITVFQEFTQFKFCYGTLNCDPRSKTIQINHKFLDKTELQNLTAKSN